MVAYSAWLSQSAALDPAARAAMEWKLIQEHPTSIAFRTAAGAVLAAQTVRVESDSSASLSTSEAGMAPRRRVILFGIKDHATLSDTDFKEGYTFILGNDHYRITDVIDTPIGERQAICEANG